MSSSTSAIRTAMPQATKSKYQSESENQGFYIILKT